MSNTFTTKWLNERLAKSATRIAVSEARIARVPLIIPALDTTQRFTIQVQPMGKPRMSRRDKWAKRECVVRYRAFKDAMKAACEGRMSRPSVVSWKAWFEMPKSWSKLKKHTLKGKLHRYKPDRDNIDKGILDALWDDDSCIADGSMTKYWDDGSGARIELTISL